VISNIPAPIRDTPEIDDNINPKPREFVTPGPTNGRAK